MENSINELYLSYISRCDAMTIENMKNMTMGKLTKYYNSLPGTFKGKTKEQTKIYNQFLKALLSEYPGNSQRHLRNIEAANFNRVCCENNKDDIELFDTHYNSMLSEIASRNREQYNQYMVEKVQCECGAIVSRCHSSRHKSSLKHTNYLKSLNI